MSEKQAPIRLLVIDDEETVRDLLKRRFERRGHIVQTTSTGEEAIALSQSFKPEVAISDIRMPGLDGFEVLKQISAPTILITGHGDKESAIRAVEAGAFSFFEKPFDLDAVEVAVKRAAEKYRWQIEREDLLQRLDRLCVLQNREIENFQNKFSSNFIGESPKIVEIKETLTLLSHKAKAPLLILGESGTGKEVVAQALHNLTHEASEDAPFIALNCSAIPPDLLESELFGHEKGAFSGASMTRVGLAEAARDGTLFLDEIGDMDPRHQTKLLRLVQERKFRRVGATQELPFMGRIIAATHRDLKSRIRENLFREDLFYRLSVVSVTLPPLRERGADIMAIAEALCDKHGFNGITPELVAELRSYPWPGNIRELNNWIERAAILNQHDAKGLLNTPIPLFNSDDGREAYRARSGTESAWVNGTKLDFNELDPTHIDIKDLRSQYLEDFDRRLIAWALQKHGDNVSAVAKFLGIDRKNLSRRLKELELAAPAPSKKKSA